MAKSEEGLDEPVDSGRDLDRDYSSDSGSSYFGGDSSFGFRGAKPATPAPKSIFSKPGETGGPRLVFGGAAPFASMPSYTPVTRPSAPPAAEPFGSHMREEAHEPAADTFAQYSADADFGDQDFSAQDPFSSSSPFDSSPAYEPESEPAPRSSFGLASSSQKPAASSYAQPAAPSYVPASSYAKPTSSFSQQPTPSRPAASFSQPTQDYEPAPASNAHAADSANYGYGGASDHAFDRYMERPSAPAEPPAPPANPSWKGASETRGNAVQAFDAGYDQHPEIALGFGSAAASRHRQPPADAGDDDQGDADFLDSRTSSIASRGRALLAQKSVLVAGALVGAVLLGGAIAYVYKGAGGDISGEPPIISADSRPVKVAPEESGGKEFPHKNKLIYDRLSGKEPAGGEKIVPHEEEVAAQNIPAADDQAAAAAPEDDDVAASEAPDQAPAEAAPEPENEQIEASAGPRRVKTLTVRPDGSVVEQQPTMTASTGPRGAPARAAPQQAAPDSEQASFVQDQEASPENVAAIPPLPASKPRAARSAQQQVAAAQPANDAGVTPVGGSGQFVVQVAARKTQTEALAAFADMQQKYPALLSGYRPMVQKADLGDKGTWYRLRVGPMGQRTAATKLCDQLRSAGLNSCLVMNE